jgi:hypothetical protein
MDPPSASDLPPGVVPDGAWTGGPVALARGRSAKDPNATTTTYTVGNLDEFEQRLREYLEASPADPEHAECHLSFWLGASFVVNKPAAEAPQQAPAQSQPGYPQTGLDAHFAAAANASNQSRQDGSALHPDGTPIKVSMSILEALAPTSNPKDQMRRQRAIAKTCVEAIQRVDGFRYSFHNNWHSREDAAYRFSYYCNDSLLNKDRAANGEIHESDVCMTWG